MSDVDGGGRALVARLSIAGGLAGGMLASILAYSAALVGQQPEDHPASHGPISLAALLPLLESIAITATVTTGVLSALVLFVGARAHERFTAATHTVAASLVAGAMQIPLLLGALLLALPTLGAIDRASGRPWSPWCADAAIQMVVPTIVFSVPIAGVFGLFYVAAVEGVRWAREAPPARSIDVARWIGRAALFVACVLAELLAWSAHVSGLWLATQTVVFIAGLGVDLVSDAFERHRAARWIGP